MRIEEKPYDYISGDLSGATLVDLLSGGAFEPWDLGMGQVNVNRPYQEVPATVQPLQSFAEGELDYGGRIKRMEKMNLRPRKPYRPPLRIEDAPRADMRQIFRDMLMAPKRADVSAKKLAKNLPLPTVPKDVEMVLSTLPAGYLTGMALNVPWQFRATENWRIPEKVAWIDKSGKHIDVGPDFSHDEFIRRVPKFRQSFKSGQDAINKGLIRAREAGGYVSLQAKGVSPILKDLAKKTIKEGKDVFADVGGESFQFTKLSDIAKMWGQ